MDTNSIPRTNEDTPSPPIPFQVQDVDDAATSLIVTASSADTNLVSNQNIQISGTGTNRTITLVPSRDQHGNAPITLTVTDPHGASTSTDFVLGINAVNDPPTLDPISNRLISPNAGPQTVNLTGITSGPANESAQNLTVTASSSNPSVVPTPTVFYSTPASNGTLTFTPVPAATGSAVVTVTVQDDAATALGGQDSISRTFLVTVSSGPSLRINRSNGLVVLSWPTNATDFHLESRADLSTSALWTAVTNVPVRMGDQNVVTNSPSGGHRFFRLTKP